jgi:hypothetical protein
VSGQNSQHVGDRQKCLSFGWWSQQTQIPTLPAKVVATAIAAAITAVVAIANAIVTVVVAKATAAAADDNGTKSIFKLLGWLWVVAAVGLLLNLEAARQGMSVLFSDEQKLLFKGGKKGFVENTKLDFMRR